MKIQNANPMRSALLTATLLGSLFTLGQAALAAEDSVCTATPEMARFQAQKNWRASKVDDQVTAGAIQGWVDQDGGFHFQNLSRTGGFHATLYVNPANTSYREFFKYCSLTRTRADFLNSMRQTRENNQYKVQVRYLPAVSGFSNDPYKEQRMKKGATRVSLTVGAEASLRQDPEFDAYLPKLKQQLATQVNAQSELGVISLDLAGQDDLVCDLVQGKAALRVESSWLSDAPEVKQTIRVNPADVVSVSEVLKALPARGRERGIWEASRAVADLGKARRTSSYGSDLEFEIFQRLMDKDLSTPLELNREQLGCVSDSLQTYEAGIESHNFGVDLIFDPLKGPQ